ncbi:hypothetical protein A3842_02750 [Paenibacillus sp. P3E]|nr:hypothetical protein A3842_02750 [Paenibacillus sp. P3E]
MEKLYDRPFVFLRKLRLQDMNLLDLLIGKTVEIAIQKGLIRSKSIIVDATHTKARYTQKSPQDLLRERSKKVRKEIYSLDKSMKSAFPVKPNDADERRMLYRRSKKTCFRKAKSLSPRRRTV